MSKKLPLLLAASALAATSAIADLSGEEPVSQPRMSPEVEAYNRGVKLMKKGWYDKALKRFQKALEIREAFAAAHNNLAYCLRKLGREHYAGAERHYDRAIELAPDLAQAYHYRGVLYVRTDRLDEAREELEALERLDPELAAQLQRVIDTGREPEVEEYYGLVERIEP